MSSTSALAPAKEPAKIAVVAGGLLRQMAQQRRLARCLLPGPKEPDVLDDKNAVTFLFTDIEGSTRLWEQQPTLMQAALHRHDEMAHAAVAAHGGTMIKMTGDGLHAAFAQPLAALHAARDFTLALTDPDNGLELPLVARCGLHLGYDEKRAGDFFGRAVNRAARIMQCAHGGQILMSQAVAERVCQALPQDGAGLLDLGLVRLRDLNEPERVHQLVHPGLREQFPALRSLASTPNNLAQQLNSFIGRERELVDLQALLDTQRLVTLVGLGGIGKTRLSMQLAAQVLDDYPDGVWFVELAPLVDPQLVPQAVASVLGVKEDAGRPITEALTRFVQDRRLLITFDNCEHVVQACADLASQLLRASPSVKLLASSREALQIAGEVTYAVPPLGVPDHRRVPTVAEVAAQESVRLFVDRVRVAQPAFVVDADSALSVGQICRQLDGIPLALELAAARARQMSVTVLASRITDRFRLLTNGDRSALPRQQTLRALIDWSHDLLSEPERALFRRLSVFAGGWTLDAAEAVCADDSLRKDDILDNLGRLVEKSLVVLDLENERYRMLETVRQYGRERLDVSAEYPVTRQSHLVYFLKLAETARPGLAGPDQGHWLKVLDTDRENLLVGHAACDSVDGGVGYGVRLAFALRPYCINCGLLGLGLRIATEALGRTSITARNAMRCNALFDVGQLCFFVGQYGRARRYLEECLSISQELRDDELVADTLQVLGMTCLGLNDRSAALECLDRGQELAKALGNARRSATAANALAQFHRSEGNTELAIVFNLETLRISREHGDLQVVAIALLNLAMLHVDRGEIGLCRKMLVETVQLSSAHQSIAIVQSLLEVCCGMASAIRDWRNASLMYAVAETLTKSSGLQRDPADEKFLRQKVAAIADAVGESELYRLIASTNASDWGGETTVIWLADWLAATQVAASQTIAT